MGLAKAKGDHAGTGEADRIIKSQLFASNNFNEFLLVLKYLERFEPVGSSAKNKSGKVRALFVVFEVSIIWVLNFFSKKIVAFMHKMARKSKVDTATRGDTPPIKFLACGNNYERTK